LEEILWSIVCLTRHLLVQANGRGNWYSHHVNQRQWSNQPG